MKLWCTNLWKRISFLGLEHVPVDLAYLHFRDIILLNRLVAVLLTVLIFYIPLEVIFNGVDLIPIIAVNFLLITLALFFNYYKKYDAARWSFLITAILSVGPLILVVPQETYYPLFMIPISTIPAILFKEKIKAMIGFAIVVLIYFLATYFNDHVPDIKTADEETIRLFSYFFRIMMFLILFFLVFYLKNISFEYEKIITTKTQELKESHDIITERNKDITDSINYAKRIQSAILPPQHFIDKFLKDYFILYKPKDIVAGDFYWAEQVGDHFFIAVADCTGHGVPGAMVSVVCSNALNRAVKEFDLTDPGKILDKTTDLVLETFEKSNEEVKDGMDISLISFEFGVSGFGFENAHTSIGQHQTPNPKPQTIKWAGANNSLYYIENNELKEIKANKQPIGYTDHRVPFTTHSLSRSLSALFLFTDGYADQFGGEKGKKFKYSNLQKLLLNNQNAKLEILNTKLVSVFDEWKRELEQVDDVCIIGIRI